MNLNADAIPIFEQWLDIKEEQRQQWLEEQCGGNAALLANVQRLIELQRSSTCMFPDADSEGVEASGLMQGDTIGDFVIESHLGAGGMGIVYKAEQLSLKRTVALKVLPKSLCHSASARRRFLLEIESAAKLHHPSIVSVYTSGEEANTVYYAMEYVAGQTLAEQIGGCHDNTRKLEANSTTIKWKTSPSRNDSIENIEERPNSASKEANRATVLHDHSREYFETIAEQLASVADGLAYAHRAGVIHRDIKPSNLLIAEDGSIKIGDFGLARRIAEPGLTQSGEIVGTPHYMSPEQIQAGAEVTSAVDIYGVGATLYECLTGRPPFPGSEREAVLGSILFEDVVRPRKLKREIPRDLETICCKAMAKEPKQRYQAADELAADLRRFNRREPINARRATIIDTSLKWIDRHRGLAAAIALFPICIAIVATAFAVKNHRLATQLSSESARANLSAFEARLETAKAARMAPVFGQRSVLLENLEAARSSLIKAKLATRQLAEHRQNLINETVAALAIPNLTVPQVYKSTSGWSPEVAFSPGYDRYAQPAIKGSVRVVSQDGSTKELIGPTMLAKQLLFSPDGRFLATKHYRRTHANGAEIYVWDLQTDAKVIDKPTLTLGERKIFYQDFGFCDEVAEFAVMSPEVGIEIYSLPSGEKVDFLPLNSPHSAVLSFSPRGQLAVAPLRETEILIFDRSKNSEQLPTKAITGSLSAIAWDQDGKALAAGTQDGELWLWPTVAEKKPQIMRPHSSEITAIHFRPRSSQLFVSSLDDHVAIADTATGTTSSPFNLPERMDLVTRGFSSDGKRIGFIRRGEFGWLTIEEGIVSILSNDVSAKSVTQLAFHPKIPNVFIRSALGLTELWDARSKTCVGELDLGSDVEIAFSQSGDFLFSSSLDEGLSRRQFELIRDATKGELTYHLGKRQRLTDSGCVGFCLNQNGDQVAVVTDRGEGTKIEILNCSSLAKVAAFQIPGRARSFAFSPDGKNFFGLATDGLLRVWNVQSGELLEEETLVDEASGVTMAPNGQWIACRSGGVIHTTSLSPTLRSSAIDLSESKSKFLAISPTGQFVAAALDSNTPVLLDARNGEVLATLTCPQNESIRKMAFAPDESLLVIAGARNIEVWDLRELDTQMHERGLAKGNLHP